MPRVPTRFHGERSVHQLPEYRRTMGLLRDAKTSGGCEQPIQRYPVLSVHVFRPQNRKRSQMSKLTNKIEAHDRRVCEVLENKKYTVDYFQREYNWQKRHIEQLITDLTNAFSNEYEEGDARTEGENYNNYYL